MTRKKSNVKALALAVTCAVLAGGYFGSTPVYASQLKTGFDIEQIEGTVNGTTISSGNLTGTITISGDEIAKSLADTDLSNARVRVTGTTTSTISLGTLYDHAAEARDTANAVKAKTKGITYDDTEKFTTVSGVKFNAGAVENVKSLKVEDYVEVGADANEILLKDGSISVGKNMASDKIKAKINADGSIEAAEGNFTVDKDGKITVANGKFEVDNVGRLTAAGGNFKVYNDGGVDATTIAATDTISAGTGTVFVAMGADGTLTATKSVKADKIEEYSPDQGIDVDGVRLKDGTVTAADGSTIGGVKFSSGNITNAESMVVKNYVKAGNYLQVGDNTKGLLYVRPEGIYIGADKGHSDETKAEILADGTIKAANGNFTVDKDGKLTAANGRFEVRTNGDGVISKDSVQVIGNNGSYAYVSNNGTVTASNGMYANSIYENDPGKGVTVDDVLLKDGGITATKDSTIGGVTLKNGTINAAKGNFGVDGAGFVTAKGMQAERVSTGDGTHVVIMGNDGTLTASDGVSTSAIYDRVSGKGVSVTDLIAGAGNTAGIKRSDLASGGHATTIEDKVEITSDGDVIINRGEKNQVKIDKNEGLVVGLNSSVVNDDGVFAGAHNYVDAKAALLASDGSFKAVDGKFYANDVGGEVVVKVTDDGSKEATLGAGLVEASSGLSYARLSGDGTISASKSLKVGKTAGDEEMQVDEDGNIITKGKLNAADGKFTVDENGNVISIGSVTANEAGFNNLAVTKGLTVGSATGDFVNMTGGNVVATGSVTAMGDLAAAGNLYVSGKSTFTDGVKTDKIEEATTDAGVNVDGVLLKDGGITAADGKFTVDKDGALSAANGKFAVDKDGNTTVAGKLNVTGDTTFGGNLGVTGNATVGGTLGVTGDASFGGNIKGKSLNIGTNGTEFTVDEDGALSAAGGKVTIDKNGNATFGDTGSNITKIEGNKFTTGYISTDANMESSIGGVTMKNGKLTAKDLSITGTLDMNNLKVNETLTVGGFFVDKTGKVTGVSSLNGATVASSGTGLKIGTATIGDTNPFSSNGYTVDANGNISAGTYNGNTIGTDKKFNGVTLDNGEVEAKKLTADTITDGNGFTAAGGNVAAKDIEATTGTIAGIAFKNNNISDVNNITASGTVKAATLKVNDNNVLDSNGLKADKAVIDNLTIDGESITSNNADGSVGIAGITVDKNGALSSVNAIDGVKVAGSTAGGLTIGDGATAVTIGGNALALSSTGFSVDNDGDIVGKSFTAGKSYLKDGELKLNDTNIWTTAEGLKAEKAAIGANSFDEDGLYTKGTLGVEGKASFGKDAANRTTIEQGTVNVTQNGKTTTISGGEITTDKLTVNDIVLKKSMTDGSGNTIEISGEDGSLSVAGGRFKVDEFGQVTNEYTTTDGEGNHIKTSFKTSQNGINADYSNASNGNNNKLSIDKDGVSLGVTNAAGKALGSVNADAKSAGISFGTSSSVVADATTIKSDLGGSVSTTLTNDGADQSIVSKVGSAKRSLKKDEIIDEVAGMTVKTDSEGTLFTDGVTSTLIKGSRITSTNGSSTGILDGSNLTLSDGTNKTEMSAGGVSYTGEAGEHGGTTTTIKGGTISTDTLNVERINLGGELYDKNGTAIGGNLSMDKDGNFSAAGGNFTIVGGSGADRGAMTNVVGNTTVKTDVDGASMGYDNGSVKSNVSVGEDNANMSSGNASVDVKDGSITSKVSDSASSTIKGDSITDKVGSTTVETKDGSFSVKGATDKGMDIDTSTGKTTFTGSDYKGGSSGTTTIDGNTITTGKLVTDQLVIKGNGSGDTSGDGGESGSIAFGGDGTITSNIKDGANETTFKTEADGVSSEVTNGKYTSNVDQSADRIGSVITGGNVRIGSVADGTLGVLQNGAGTVDTATGETLTEASQAFSKDGTITSVAKDADGNSSKLIQDGKGLEYTDSANADNATRISSSDVSIGSATDDSKRINLSDLGQIDDLDSELTSRDEFTSNKTAVGAINAEAAVRREEVARLDGRINDVNDRVDKVGAMAAAIASLKSIGYDPQAPSEFSVGLGQYKGETGVALGFFHYPNKNFMINVSLSTAGGETMGGIGATWRFGHKSPQKLLDEQREAQAKKELAAAAKYQAAAQLAKEAQERAEYAAKLARQAQVSADNAKAAADATQAKNFNK